MAEEGNPSFRNVDGHLPLGWGPARNSKGKGGSLLSMNEHACFSVPGLPGCALGARSWLSCRDRSEEEPTACLGDPRTRLTTALLDEASTEETLFKRSFQDSDNGGLWRQMGRRRPAEGAEVKRNGNELCSLSFSTVSWDLMWKISAII